MGHVGPRLQVSSPSGLLEFVLRALRPLRPCDPRNGALNSEKSKQKSPRNTNKIIAAVVILLVVVVVLVIVIVHVHGWCYLVENLF